MSIRALWRKTRLPRLLRRESGQALIEMAVVLPTFFLLIFGFIDFCLIVFSMGNANFASRAALRYASTHSSSSYLPATQQAFTSLVAPLIFQYPANTWSIAATYYRENGATVDNVVGNGICTTLTISYTFNVLGRAYSPIAYSSTGCGVILQ